MNLSDFGEFLLSPELGKDDMYRVDEIWSPSAFEKLVAGRV